MVPESMLAKKHNSFDQLPCHLQSGDSEDPSGRKGGWNLADLFTKALTADRCRSLCKHIMY